MPDEIIIPLEHEDSITVALDGVEDVVIPLLPDEELITQLPTVGGEVQVLMAYFSSVGGSNVPVTPEDQIRAWDAEVLDQAHTYADQIYIDLGNEIDNLTPTVQRIDQVSSNNEYRILELKGRVDNLVIPTVDVTKAYVNAADVALGARIDEITPGKIGAASSSDLEDLTQHFARDIQTISDSLEGKADVVHTHTKAQAGLSNVDNTSDANKPVSTAQAAALAGKSDTGHRHLVSDITDLPATPTWSTLSGKPTTFPPSTHQHSAADTTSGVFPPARLGTGTANGSSFLSGDGTFKIPPGATNEQIESAVNSYLTANPVAGIISGTYVDPNGTVTASPGTIYRYTVNGGSGPKIWFKRLGTDSQGWEGLQPYAPSVSFSTGAINTTIPYAANTFLPIQYSPSSTTNVGGGVWNVNQSTWYAPVTGTYLLVGSIRWPDNTPPLAFSTGIHTGANDGPHGLWTFSASPTTRPMTQYTRILRVAAGTGLMQYIYHSAGGPMYPIGSGQGCNWSAALLSAG